MPAAAADWEVVAEAGAGAGTETGIDTGIDTAGIESAGSKIRVDVRRNRRRSRRRSRGRRRGESAELEIRQLRQLLGPLHELRRAAERLGDGGFHLRRPVPHQLAGEIDKVFVPPAARVVFRDRLAEARGLFELGVEVHRRLHQVVAELRAEFAEHFTRQFRAGVVQRRQHADLQLVSTLLAHHLQRLHHLRQPVQAEIPRLHGDDDFVAGLERVEGDQAHAGRAVDHTPLVARLDRCQGLGESILATGPAGENLFECRQANVARREIEIGRDLPDDVGNLRGPAVAVLDQGVEDRPLDLVLGHGQTDAAMALRVHVDEKGLLAETGEARGQVDAGRRLPAAAFLIDDRDCPHRRTFLGPAGEMARAGDVRRQPVHRPAARRCKTGRSAGSNKRIGAGASKT